MNQIPLFETPTVFQNEIFWKSLKSAVSTVVLIDVTLITCECRFPKFDNCLGLRSFPICNVSSVLLF